MPPVTYWLSVPYIGHQKRFYGFGDATESRLRLIYYSVQCDYDFKKNKNVSKVQNISWKSDNYADSCAAPSSEYRDLRMGKSTCRVDNIKFD